MMDPLITNAIDPALLRALDKRGQERDPVPRPKRPAAPKQESAEENVEEENNNKDNKDEEPDSPKHVLDDLA
jgi:hypothetical protein